MTATTAALLVLGIVLQSSELSANQEYCASKDGGGGSALNCQFKLNNKKLDHSNRPAPPRKPASDRPADDFERHLDKDKYYDLAFKHPIAITSAVLAPRDATSPSAAAALAYMKAQKQEDICSKSTQAYLEKILAGGTVDEANAEATAQYIDDYNKGLRVELNSACDASDIAWRAAEAAGKDPVLASAVAFMENWAGMKEGNPCAVSGRDYVNAIIGGSSHLEANRLAAKGFAAAIKKLAAEGKELRDPACAAATKAFFNALPQKPSPPNAAAMIAFLDKAFESFSFEYDPVCWKSTEAFFDSYAAGNDELTSNLAAAEVFLNEFSKSGLSIPADSPCAVATRAYYQNIPNPPSPPNKAAMEAFMDQMIAGGKREPDPVCAASTIAYWKAYKAGAKETDANLAAAEAFLDAFEKGLSIPAESPCAVSTKAYFNALDTKPSPPNAIAMIAFMDAMIAQGNKRVPDPVCAASTRAYWKAYKAGAKETEANLAAAEEFLKAFEKGLSIPANSPCAISTKAYFKALDVKPSQPNAIAMMAFMDAMISQGNKRVHDPVCAASSKAFFDAYKAGDDELTANLKAAHAFFKEYKKGAKVPTNSPCLVSTKAYADAIRNKPSPPNAAAMLAFMDEAILTNMSRPDPVCMASAEAYFEAYASGVGEAKANEIAGVAFLDAVAANPDFDPGSPCGISAQAYIAAFHASPSLGRSQNP